MILTHANAEALRRIRGYGSTAWCKGKGRAGGAVSRMFERMASHGWCTRAPHEITEAGKKALDAFDFERGIEWCCFCKTSHSGGATCMGHHP